MFSMTDIRALSLSIYAEGYGVDPPYVFEYNDTDYPQHPTSVGSQRRGRRWMDTLELDPRLRYATTLLGSTPKMLIDGKMVGAVSGETFEVVNPATGAVIANVPSADKADVDRAVAAARRAFDDGVWAKVSPSEKSRMMWRIADLIERDLEELAELESIDNGKPMRSLGLPICRLRSTCSAIWVVGRPRSAVARSRGRCPANFSPTRSRNRSALLARSSRGTSRC